MREYFNYHKHSHISNIMTVDSNTKPEEYAKRYVELGQKCFSTCEHGGFGDQFISKHLTNQYGLKCLAIGEFYIVPNPLDKDKTNNHIIVAPLTNEARKLCNYASSHANMDGYYYKPRLFIEDLLAINPHDVLITSACVSGLLKNEVSFKKIFMPLYEHFGNNIMLEVQAHDVDIQKDINRRALKLHKEYGIPLVAACDSHYINDEGRKERDELLLGKGIHYEEENGFILDFPDGDTLHDRFVNQGVLSEEQINSAMQNSMLFTEAEDLFLDHSIKMPTIYPELSLDERLNLLKKKINVGFAKICKEENIKGEEFQQYKDGIRYEMKTIEDTNEVIHTADYLLLNEKVVKLAQEKYGGVLTRGGRGSAGSFYINRVLGLTQLDRFKINLPIYPDRFMSTARLLENRALPDWDANVESQEPFVKATRELLGEHGCYPMVALGCLQGKESFKNVCRSKGIDFGKSNEISQNLEEYEDGPKWHDIIEESKKYVGTIVSVSPHPCAHLLDSKDLLYEYGVIRVGDVLCVLVTSGEADEWKLLKNDYLIVSVWHLIAETFRVLGKPIIPARELLKEIKDDERIWNLFRDGIVCTLNQVDSTNGGQQAQEYGIHSFEDGALIAAAIRPSFDSWRDVFLKREPYSTGVKQLDEVLSQTGGFILFQESLMAYFQWLDITPAESIGLIKKISKKKIKPEDFANLEDRLRISWKGKIGSEEGFDDTWKLVQSCISYGFCAAHAAATSLDMCYGAYLKVHYPLQYYTVCLNTYQDNQDKTMRLTHELDYFGIKLKPIVFRHSVADYSFDEATNTIYQGLGALKYMSSSVADELYTLRNNEYATFIDALPDITATSIDTRQLTILIKIGFFEEFGEPNALLKQYELYQTIMKRKTYKKSEIESGKCQIPEFLISAHAGKVSEKQYTQIDQMGLLKDLVSHIELPKTTVFDRMDYELEVLDYITTTVPDYDPRFSYIINIDGKFKKKYVTLYQICSGKTATKKFEVKAPIKIGDIICIDEISNKYKWRKTGVDANGKPTFERLDEKEQVVTGYRVTRPAKNT